MRVAIAGAGKVGRSIAGELLVHEHEVLLIDPEATTYRTDLAWRRLAARGRLRDLFARRSSTARVPSRDRGHR